MQVRANRTMKKTPKKYSRLSSKGHCKYWLQTMFLVSISMKLKIQTSYRGH